MHDLTINTIELKKKKCNHDGQTIFACTFSSHPHIRRRFFGGHFIIGMIDHIRRSLGVHLCVEWNAEIYLTY